MVKALADCHGADAEGGSFFEADVFGDMHLDVALGNNVFCKSSVLVLKGIAAMTHAADPVAFLELLFDIFAHFFYCSCVITADKGALGSQVVDVLPVCRI